MKVLSGKTCLGNNLFPVEVSDKRVLCVRPPGAPLVKALPVNPTDPAVTGPDIFAKLVPMAAHEASSLYRCVLGCSADGHGSGWSRTASRSRSSGCSSQQGARALAQQLCKLKRAGSWRFSWGTANIPESFSRLASVQCLSWQLELALPPQRASSSRPGDGRGSGQFPQSSEHL